MYSISLYSYVVDPYVSNPKVMATGRHPSRVMCSMILVVMGKLSFFSSMELLSGWSLWRGLSWDCRLLRCYFMPKGHRHKYRSFHDTSSYDVRETLFATRQFWWWTFIWGNWTLTISGMFQCSFNDVIFNRVNKDASRFIMCFRLFRQVAHADE